VVLFKVEKLKHHHRIFLVKDNTETSGFFLEIRPSIGTPGIECPIIKESGR